MDRGKIIVISLATACCLSAYAIYSWVTFRPPEILTEQDACRIAFEVYHDTFEAEYNYSNVHIVVVELRDDSVVPWAPRPRWYVMAGSNAIVGGEPYNLCLDIEIDAVSGKVLRSVARP
ncbi:hypothetical protein GH157_04540 [archaeon]|nr:hypothetical protein [archaeon]